MAGITTPFTTPTFPFLQTVSQRALDTITPAFVLQNGPTRRADRADADRRPRAGRVRGRRHARLGLRAAVERVGAARADDRTRRSRPRMSDRTSRTSASPTRNLNQLSVESARAGRAAAARACRTRTSASSRGRRRSAIRRLPSAQLLKPYPGSTRRSASIATTSARRAIRGSSSASASGWRTGCSYSVAYTRSKLMDDASSVFDASILTGPIANYPVADSFNRALERDYSTGDIPHVFVSSVVWDLPVGAGPRAPAARRARRDRQRLDGDGARHAAVGRAGRGHADDELQRVRRLRRAAAESGRRSHAAGRPAHAQPVVQHRGVRRRAACSRIGSASRNPVRGPSYRNVDLALMRRVPIRAGTRARAPRRGLQPVEHAEPRRPQRRPGSAALRHDHHGARPARGAARAETGLLSPMDWSAVALSLRLAAATTIVLLAIGLPLASWLALSNRRGRWAVDALVALPLVLPPTVLGTTSS